MAEETLPEITLTNPHNEDAAPSLALSPVRDAECSVGGEWNRVAPSASGRPATLVTKGAGDGDGTFIYSFPLEEISIDFAHQNGGSGMGGAIVLVMSAENIIFDNDARQTGFRQQCRLTCTTEQVTKGHLQRTLVAAEQWRFEGDGRWELGAVRPD